MLEPRKRTALDGRSWWYVFDTDTMKWSDCIIFGKYRTRKACWVSIDYYLRKNGIKR